MCVSGTSIERDGCLKTVVTTILVVTPCMLSSYTIIIPTTANI